jgi:large subunit ribosomal protein L22
MEKTQATLRYLQIAPRKVRLVSDLIKGLSVNEAEAQLLHMTRRPSEALLKLLRSAMANAKNSGHSTSTWIVENVRVDGGPMLKRFLPRARGMATPLQKKMSHITLTLAEAKEKKNPRFTINKPKKAKKVEGDRPRSASKSTQKKQDREDIKTKDAVPVTGKDGGILKRVFTRKSNMGN